MIEQADAVVIGGGILGASVAHFLTRLEYGQVVLVEKSRICGGSTQYSAAHVRQHYTNEVAIRLAVRAVEMFENDEEELGGPTGFTRLGYLVLAPPGQEQALIDVVPFQRSLGVETAIVSVDDVAARYPELDLDGVALGCYETTAGYADPVLTVQSLVRSAERRGLKVYEGCRVIGIATARGKATGVITGEGEISAPVVVNATGPWGDRTGRMVGIEYPLELSREHEAHFDVPDGFGDLPVVSDAAQRLYFRPFGKGRVLVGEGWPKEKEPADPESYDDRADDHVVARMAEKLARRLPRLRNTVGQPGYGGTFVTGYSGVYDITADWYPIVGAEEIEGYYSAFGGSGHCFKLGPAIGEALADVIAGREPAIDISPLSGTRFAEGRLFGSVWGPGNRA